MSDIKAMYRRVMDDHFPDQMTITLGDQTLVYRKQTWKIPEADGTVVEKGLRYGENPGQEAAMYRLVNGHLLLAGVQFIGPGRELVSGLEEDQLVQFGKHPSKTNLTDVDAGLGILKYLAEKPTVVIIKHNNPCGVCQADSLAQAYDRANMADRIAAFGGAAAFNRPLDRAAAELVAANYLEVVAAPDYEEGAVAVLSRKKDVRIVRIPRLDRLAEYAPVRFLDFKSLMDGGVIVQQSSLNAIGRPEDFLPAEARHQGQTIRPVREPTRAELEDLFFGWAVEQGVTSNSVLYVKDRTTVGIGTGEQDRVGVAEIAVFKAYQKFKDALCFRRRGRPYKDLLLDVEQGRADRALVEAIDAETTAERAGLRGARMVSDAFFPFRDGVDVALREGISAIAHPGGSMRDHEAIIACNEADPPAAMVFTGQRAFKH